MVLWHSHGTGADDELSEDRQNGRVGSDDKDDGPRRRASMEVLAFVRKPEGLDEDLYGMAVASLVRDSQRFAVKTELLWLRVSRLGIALSVLCITMFLQVFLLYEMKHLVTSASTHHARTTYDKYELWMYGNTTENMHLTKNGYHRGTEGHFDITRFSSLDDETKNDVCQIPLSKPSFFIAVLLVWALVCCAEMRHTLHIACRLLWSTPTIPSMRDSIKDAPEEGDEAVIVVGLTLPIKLIAAIFVFLPRLLVSGILLWLGSRWLTGTLGFSDLLQNAVTLEFISLLKDMFYHAMVPVHCKLETRNTLILPDADKEHPTAMVFIGAFLWGVVSIGFVILYVGVFQQVLPDYRWDIHEACSSYLASIES